MSTPPYTKRHEHNRAPKSEMSTPRQSPMTEHEETSSLGEPPLKVLRGMRGYSARAMYAAAKGLSETQTVVQTAPPKSASQSFLISGSNTHLNIGACSWEVLWITLKLAKVFPKERCIEMQVDGGQLSVLDLHKIRMHIKHVLFMSMQSGDYLMSDLTLSDIHPEEAFIDGDPRRYQFLDRDVLDQLLFFITEIKGSVSARRLMWNQDRFQRKSGHKV